MLLPSLSGDIENNSNSPNPSTGASRKEGIATYSGEGDLECSTQKSPDKKLRHPGKDTEEVLQEMQSSVPENVLSQTGLTGHKDNNLGTCALPSDKANEDDNTDDGSYNDLSLSPQMSLTEDDLDRLEKEQLPECKSNIAKLGTDFDLRLFSMSINRGDILK